ncbi:restriction endonuclease [Vibrio parahaemolyticus]|uniref:restriction endonuclease n=1 Tax=Vibrio parahaemolyticus TaxID=670 RepID=UPI000A3C8F68
MLKMSNLDNLSPIDFEELCRDIASQKMGVSFSAFGPGPDGGIDGRHSTAEGDIIMQCKHYSKTSFSGLKKKCRKREKKVRYTRTQTISVLHISLTYSK